MCVKRYFTPLKPEQSVTDRYEGTIQDKVKREVIGEDKDVLFRWGRREREKKRIFLEVPQVPPSRPTDKGSMKLKKLELLDVVAWDGAAEFWFAG
jgi:hypothetical protein